MKSYWAIVPIVLLAIVLARSVVRSLADDFLGLPYGGVDPLLIEVGIIIAILATYVNVYRLNRADARQAEDGKATSEYREQRLANDIRIIDALRRIEANRP